MKNVTASPQDLLKTVLPEYPPASEMRNHEVPLPGLYKSIDSAQRVYLIRDPRLWGTRDNSSGFYAGTETRLRPFPRYMGTVTELQKNKGIFDAPPEKPRKDFL